MGRSRTASSLRQPAGIAYGGDYNPEQWPAEVWPEDVALMRQAGVNLVSVGIFSWALLEPAEGQYEFGWLDRVLDLLHAGGIAVDLATPTAAPPAWLLRQSPEIRPRTREGHVLGPGARNGFCPSAPGGHLPACYCELSAVAFRDWLRRRYHDLGELNRAWATTFWGQRYGEWEELEPPRLAPTAINPTQQLDFLRFSSDAYLECYLRERDLLRALTPDTPVTTNFMTGNCKNIDYWRWASEVDVVANNHYLKAEQADNYIDLAMAADLASGVVALAGEAAALTGEAVARDGELAGDVWAEEVVLAGAEPVWHYRTGPAAGLPAVTRHRVGAGTAWYVSTRLRGAHLDAVLHRAYRDAGVAGPAGFPDGVEVVRRAGEGASYLVAINHTGQSATVPVAAGESVPRRLARWTACSAPSWPHPRPGSWSWTHLGRSASWTPARSSRDMC